MRRASFFVLLRLCEGSRFEGSRNLGRDVRFVYFCINICIFRVFL